MEHFRNSVRRSRASRSNAMYLKYFRLMEDRSLHYACLRTAVGRNDFTLLEPNLTCRRIYNVIATEANQLITKEQTQQCTVKHIPRNKVIFEI